MKYVVLATSLGKQFVRGHVVSVSDFPEVGADKSNEKDKLAEREKRIAHWLSKGVLRKATPEEENHEKVHVDPNYRPSVEEDLRVANDRINLLDKQNNELLVKVQQLEKDLRSKEPVVAVEETPQYKKVIAEKDKVIDELRKQLNSKK